MMLRFRSFCVLLEDRVDFIKKQNPNLDPSDIDYFATHADPTTKKTHTQWIVNQYKTGKIAKTDHSRIKDTLQNFEKYKGKLDQKDINHYRSLDDIDSATKPHSGMAASNKQVKQQVKTTGSKVVYADDKVTVRRLDTFGAAKLYGANTKWCTSSSEQDFNYCKRKGKLFVVHTPEGKIQYHPATGEMKDARDEPTEHSDLVNHYPNLTKVSAFKNPNHFSAHHFITDPTEKENHLDRLMSHKDEQVRRAVATTSSERAGKLVSDPSGHVRSEVARYPEHATRLIADPDRAVSDMAKKTLGMKPDYSY